MPLTINDLFFPMHEYFETNRIQLIDSLSRQ
jgi:hypothetical protein